MEQILSIGNLNAAYRQVRSNGGSPGIDKMDCNRLPNYLRDHGEQLTGSIRQRTYYPNPVRRVEMPKDNGKKRRLGIPTVVDRMVQQAVNQALASIHERQFSRTSYGFRSKRSCHDALGRVQKTINDGYAYAVDLDPECFFDAVSHSKVRETLGRIIKNGRVASLIHKYLRGGVINRGLFEAGGEGTPQGGPPSPLSGNIMLNELDKELESRGLPFVRYADDAMRFCKSK